MSISKVQAQALADGFLDDIGSGDYKTLQPRETFSELILLAGEMVEDMQSNLNASNSNASGRLSESIEIGEPETRGNILQVDIFMNHYGQFVNKGVKGTKSGSSLAGFTFKYDKPSKSMVDAIREWKKAGKIKTTNVNKAKTISSNEKKNATIGEIDNAYAVARSITQHGIPPTGFLDKAAATTEAKVSDQLGLALEIDVINAIT